MDTVFNSIDEVSELTVAWYNYTRNRKDYFYLSEQSSLQVLRELPLDTSVKVKEIFLERQYTAQKIDLIKSATTVEQFLEVALRMFEGGHFYCKDIKMVLDGQIELSSHDDSEVHIISANKCLVQDLVSQVLIRQKYSSKLLSNIMKQPDLYHVLERPGKIVSSFSSFDELIEAL